MSATHSSTRSATSARFDSLPELRLSSTVTRATPERSSARARLLPMNPAPPVTTIFDIILHSCCTPSAVLQSLDQRLQMADRPAGNGLRAGREIECLQRNPFAVIQLLEAAQQRGKIIVSGAAMFPVHLVNMDVADQLEITLDERGVRLRLVHGVVSIEHRPHARTADPPHNARGFGQRANDVALAL